MVFQLRYRRLFFIWLLASGLCLLTVFSIHQSGTGAGLAWSSLEAVVDEPKPNAVIVMLVEPSRILRAFAYFRWHSPVVCI
jgi:hypothetical protein